MPVERRADPRRPGCELRLGWRTPVPRSDFAPGANIHPPCGVRLQLSAQAPGGAVARRPGSARAQQAVLGCATGGRHRLRRPPLDADRAGHTNLTTSWRFRAAWWRSRSLLRGKRPPARLVPDGRWSPRLEIEVEAAGREIREVLDRYLSAIATQHPGARAFVCLSGGLDSSGIARSSRITSRTPSRSASTWRSGAAEGARTGARPSTGARSGPAAGRGHCHARRATRLARHRAREGIDWRDFNVHAALVNAALAAAIADAAEVAGAAAGLHWRPGERVPRRLPPRALPWGRPTIAASARTGCAPPILVRGLDTCHREVGVFGAWHLPLIQPYAVAVDTYCGFPTPSSGSPTARSAFARRSSATPPGLRLPPQGSRTGWRRGQAGGVLAACVDRGVDADALRRRFAELHGVADDRSLDRFIRAGGYRARAPSIPEVGRERA